MIEKLDSSLIDKTLESEHRQYLCGDLKLPQKLENLKDDEVEIGITLYDSYRVEKPHYHTTCSEYQYILEGKTKYLDLSTMEEVEMKKGDFFIIRRGTKYYQKALKGTKILFFKYPAGNDKILVKLSKEQENWGKEY